MDNSLNIFDLINIILKKWWVAAISMFSVALVMFVYARYFVPPVYETSGSLYVSNSKNTGTGTLYGDNSEVSLNSLLTSQEMLKTCVEILSTNRFYERVKAVSALNLPISSLKSMVKMEQKNETNILQVSVSAADPDTAYTLIETFMSCASDEVDWIVEGGNIKTINHATYSTSAAAKGARNKAFLGALIGFIISSAILILLEFVDTRVKNSDDLTQYNLYILAEIPKVADEKR